MRSFAYLSDVSGWEDSIKGAISADFIGSDVGDMEVVGLAELERLRVARCDKLTKLTVKDCPNIAAIDCSIAANLVSVTIINCPKLRALDVSFCDKLVEVSGTFDKLEYLSIPYCRVRTLPKMPMLKYMDCHHNQVSFPLKDFPTIEVYYGFMSDNEITLRELTSAKSLRKVLISHTAVNLDSTAWFSNLEWLSLQRCEVTGKASALKKVFYLDSRGNWNGYQPKPHPFSYLDAHLLLYGPWGVPPGDQEEWEVPPQVFTPPELDRATENTVVEALVGCVFGQGMGDMLGVGCEFMSKAEVAFYLQEDLGITWTHPRVSDHTASFIRGTATDDTSQSVLIMRMLVKNGGEVNLSDFAERLLEWLREGHKEHRQGGGLGAGSTTSAVMNHKDFLTDPVAAARETWERMGRDAASNGAVMRTGPCGCLKFWDEDFVINTAKLCAAATHADPRCVFSSVAISLLISRILQQKAKLIEGFDIDETISVAMSKVDDLEQYTEDIRKLSSAATIEELRLGERPIGYTLKTYGSAVWALRHCTSYAEAISQVVREGGDTDTNAAVVGAVMGAKFGFHKLPSRLIQYMFEGAWLLREIKQYIALMGYGMSANAD